MVTENHHERIRQRKLCPTVPSCDRAKRNNTYFSLFSHTQNKESIRTRFLKVFLPSRLWRIELRTGRYVHSADHKELDSKSDWCCCNWLLLLPRSLELRQALNRINMEIVWRGAREIYLSGFSKHVRSPVSWERQQFYHYLIWKWNSAFEHGHISHRIYARPLKEWAPFRRIVNWFCFATVANGKGIG